MMWVEVNVDVHYMCVMSALISVVCIDFARTSAYCDYYDIIN